MVFFKDPGGRCLIRWEFGEQAARIETMMY